MVSTSMTSVILLDFYQNNADSFTLYHHFEADRLREKKKKKGLEVCAVFSSLDT